MLATGDEPELHRMLLERRQHGEWQFPVVIEKETAKPWDDAAYLSSMKIDSKQGEREDVRAIRQAHKHGKHTLRELADSTAMELNRVKDLVHKYSLPLTNDYWRAEKYNNPDEVIAYQTLARLCERIDAPEFSIRQASMSNGIVNGYYISRVPKV
ncbi:prophage P2a protein 23 [Lactiplantibacillus plantarum]|nr:prophage P2a protein 23 [Lactiplantibacillus plantarum]MCG0745194.1 prophage P2a protein 23 [Lactiplantibacillus plantarum]